MLNIINFLIPISLAAVTLVLFMGLYALFRGGDFGRSNSNKLMRLRVLMVRGLLNHPNDEEVVVVVLL